MNSLSLIYEGYFSDSITAQLAGLMENALVENSLDYKTRSRLKALLVEQIQNIQRYSNTKRQGVVEVGNDGGALYVKTSNPIDPQDKDALNDRLGQLVASDAKTLQEKYREAMREPLGHDDLGAGLGFLLLAKKSSRRLDYRFISGPGQDISFQLTSYI